MDRIQEIRKRLENIEKKIGRHESDLKSLREELDAITQKIYQEVDKANEKDREKIDELIMLKNIIKYKLR